MLRVFGKEVADEVNLTLAAERDGRKLRNEKINYITSPLNFSGDRITKNGMGGTCGTHGYCREVTGFWWGNLRERA